ncbi:MAG: hypothetical protein V4773_16045, partial [Verrucomicrobiota bacterium]
MKHALTFVATFLLGALIALAARTATHSPHEHERTSTPTAATPQPPSAKPETSPTAAPVNTVCAICGMKVDPALPT